MSNKYLAVANIYMDAFAKQKAIKSDPAAEMTTKQMDAVIKLLATESKRKKTLES